MRTRAYIRVAKHGRGYTIDAHHKPRHGPIKRGSGMSRRDLPTVSFAIDLKIPDELFKQAERVIAEIEIPESSAQIEATVREIDSA